jgi:hypothetical protein
VDELGDRAPRQVIKGSYERLSEDQGFPPAGLAGTRCMLCDASRASFGLCVLCRMSSTFVEGSIRDFVGEAVRCVPSFDGVKEGKDQESSSAE